MDSHYLNYSVTGAGLSYSNASSIPTTTRMFRPLEFDSRNSLNRHFSNHFDSETLFSYFHNQEQNSSIHESNPSLDYSAYFQQSGASPFCFQDTSLINAKENNVADAQHIRHALQELENALMAVDEEEEEEVITSHQYENLHRPENLKQLLNKCAEALLDHRLVEFERLVRHARGAVSICGEPIQRLGAYMLEGLVARQESSGSNIYRALKCNEPDSKDLLSYMRILYEVCPYWKFSYMAANGAIAEACKNEDHIHIIDFQIAQARQWTTLLQALATRPGGPPNVRITGIDDPVSEYARGEGLAAVGEQFEAISKKFNIPVEFHGVPVFALDVTREMLDVRPNEALAVNFPLQLHHTPDESVDVSNPRDRLIRMVKSLGPKVVTLVEQESNTNTAAFVPRFIETFEYYSAMFESIDVGTTREFKDRIKMEQHCLGRDIVNMIACEGKERVERHELLGKWRLRFMMAGFRTFPLSSYVNSVIGRLLKSYSEHYRLVEKDGAMLLGWKDRNLISASAWQ